MVENPTSDDEQATRFDDVSPYLRRPARTLEEYLRDRDAAAEAVASLIAIDASASADDSGPDGT